jgi:hypothetical protein
MQTNFAIFKFPRGFIKILQLVFSIIGFAVLAGYSSSGSFVATVKVSAINDTQITLKCSLKVEYPFGSNQYTLTKSSSSAIPCPQPNNVDGSFKSDAQFLVAVGVLAFLYTLAMGVLYTAVEIHLDVFQLKLYYSADFVATCLLAFFYLVAGGVWARGSDGVIDNVNLIYSCQNLAGAPCSLSATNKPNYSGMIAAVVRENEMLLLEFKID